jgi:hypothetical protein
MPCQINNTSNFDISEIEELIQDLFSFSQSRLGFKENPCLNLVSDENNVSPLGKTAHYDPSSMQITIYVDGRHPKDIMRSFSHELIHHNQNENGMFKKLNNTGAGYAQSNPHLRKMEKEAYLKGNMCFRDWEDGYKSSNPNILNERRIYKMSIKKWKNKELNGLLNEKWGFSMNLNKLNEGCGDVEEEALYEAEAEDSFASDDGHDENEENEAGEEELEENIEMNEADKEMTIGQRIQQVTALRDALRKGILQDTGLNIPPEKLVGIVDMVIDAAAQDTKSRTMGYKKFSKIPPKDGGNDGGQGGAPAQVQEKKLREAIRKIIKSKFNKKKK